ncbi:amino acid ABC transporter permease/ATP-binding protein [Neorhizobium sp. CSC1952]|uniref:amino acid ABC transporter permease/ATP-binding protein n=1 Tax=Neorhizobium sp. CSC1952 TaxID=2978974 RepID=UPI0025A5C373|nr:amino acid ABC transporter permease/ATP-binding protein [Rhizobium sp. CSC1952]WJR65084.1 amino acid ABC transporter permease/ATP-binding protein [Rhizobium sp. CSC1952]
MTSWDSALFLQVLASPVIAKAAWTTLWVATLAQLCGTLIGIATAPAMMAKARLPRFIAFLYLWVFRGTPLLAQILFFYAALPQMGIRLNVLTTGLLALSLNEGARMAEIVRSGLLSVPQEQREAAAALGFRKVPTFFLVVMPQAMRAIVPPLCNNYSYMIKATSLLAAISFAELLRTSQQLAQSTARPLEIYTVAAIWYMAIICLVTLGQYLLERRMERTNRQRTMRNVDPSPVPAASARTAPPVAREPEDVPDTPPLIAASGLVKRLGATLALDHVDFSVHSGQVVAVLGPSGSGKSTLLRCLNHIEVPDEGVVMVEGQPMGFTTDAAGRRRPVAEAELDRQRRRMGMVFQRFHLFEHLTARRNITIGLERVLKIPRREACERADALLARFGLGQLADRYPGQLSGGQKQRVAIARAISMAPSAILFDEPTSALDPESVKDVLDAMRDLARQGMTMVVVTHEIGFARAVADRVVIMAEGRIIEQGSAARVFEDPRDPRTKSFLALLSSNHSAASSPRSERA